MHSLIILAIIIIHLWCIWASYALLYIRTWRFFLLVALMTHAVSFHQTFCVFWYFSPKEMNSLQIRLEGNATQTKAHFDTFTWELCCIKIQNWHQLYCSFWFCSFQSCYWMNPILYIHIVYIVHIHRHDIGMKKNPKSAFILKNILCANISPFFIWKPAINWLNETIWTTVTILKHWRLHDLNLYLVYRSFVVH